VISSAALVTTVAISLFIQPADQSNEVFNGGAGFKMSESGLGDRLSLADAEQHALFDFSVPEKLPAGTTLERVYVSETRTLVHMFYSNRNFPRFSGSGGIIASLEISATVLNNNVKENQSWQLVTLLSAMENIRSWYYMVFLAIMLSSNQHLILLTKVNLHTHFWITVVTENQKTDQETTL